MAILKKTILLLLMAAGLSSCYEDFVPDVDSTPVLCLNALVEEGKPIDCSLSRTRLYGTPGQPGDFRVDDATLQLYVDGEPRDIAGHCPAAGERLRIVADSPVYGRAEGEVTVPEAVAPGEVRVRLIPGTMHAGMSDDGYFEASAYLDIELEIELPDPAGTENYYRVFYYGTSPHYDYEELPDGVYDDFLGFYRPIDFNLGEFEYDSEPIFSEHIGVFDSVMGGDAYGFTLFTDRQFDGRTYTLHLNFRNVYYSLRVPEFDDSMLDCNLLVELLSVSKSFYDWSNYTWQVNHGPMGDLSGAGLGEPVWAYSNVSSGAGVVSAQAAPAPVVVPLASFLREHLFPAQ